MSLVPSVTELMVAEFLYLQYDDEKKPIYLVDGIKRRHENGVC